MPADIAFLFLTRHDNAYSLNPLAAAVESRWTSREVETVFVKNPAELDRILARAPGDGRQVILGWSFCSVDWPRAVRLLREIRRKHPGSHLLHLAGGPHAGAEPERTLQSGFDCVAIGEGENIVLGFVQALQEGRPPWEVPGVAALRDGQMVGGGRGAPADLDAFPPYPLRHNRFQPLEITRGCPYACRYCQISYQFTPRFRHRSAESVRECVGQLHGAGLRDIRFISPSSLSYGSPDRTVHLEKVSALLETVREIIGKSGRIFFGTFPSEVRPEHVSHESLRLLKKMVNNDNLLIGAQSGSDRLLEECRRGHSVATAVEAVRLALEYGFKPQVDIIFGLPGERPEEARASLQLAETLAGWGARIHAHTFMPLPGTPWRGQVPGTLDPSTQRRLKQLAASGRVFGKWEGQIRSARQLAADAPR